MSYLIGRIIFGMDNSCDVAYCQAIASEKIQAISSLFELEESPLSISSLHDSTPNASEHEHSCIVYELFAPYVRSSLHKSLKAVASELVGGNSPFLMVTFEKYPYKSNLVLK